MTGVTLRFRQVRPSWMREGRVTSQAFRPTPKDERRPSVYDGDLVTAAGAWNHFTGTLGLASAGVVAVTVAERQQLSLAVLPDPQTFEAHALVDYTGLTENEVLRTGKQLSVCAVQRGWQHQPDGNP